MNISSYNFYNKNESFNIKFYFSGKNIMKDKSAAYSDVKLNEIGAPEAEELKAYRNDYVVGRNISANAKKRAKNLSALPEGDRYFSGSNGQITVDVVCTEHDGLFRTVHAIVYFKDVKATTNKDEVRYIACDTQDLAYNHGDTGSNQKYRGHVVLRVAKTAVAIEVKNLRTFDDLNKGNRVERIKNAINHLNHEETEELSYYVESKAIRNDRVKLKKEIKRAQASRIQAEQRYSYVKSNHTIESFESIMGEDFGPHSVEVINTGISTSLLQE